MHRALIPSNILTSALCRPSAAAYPPSCSSVDLRYRAGRSELNFLDALAPAGGDGDGGVRGRNEEHGLRRGAPWTSRVRTDAVSVQRHGRVGLRRGGVRRNAPERARAGHCVCIGALCRKGDLHGWWPGAHHFMAGARWMVECMELPSGREDVLRCSRRPGVCLPAGRRHGRARRARCMLQGATRRWDSPALAVGADRLASCRAGASAAAGDNPSCVMHVLLR